MSEPPSYNLSCVTRMLRYSTMTMEELYAAFQQKRAAAAHPTTPAVAAPVDKPANEARQPCLRHTDTSLQHTKAAHVASSLWPVASGDMAVHAAPLQGQQAVRVQPFAGVMRVKLERLEALERTRLQKLAEAELARAEVERLQEDAKRLQAEEAAKRQLARCASLAEREHKELDQEKQFTF